MDFFRFCPNFITNYTLLKPLSEYACTLSLKHLWFYCSGRYCFGKDPQCFPGYHDGSASKESACNAGDTGDANSLGWEYPLEKETATHSNILVWEIPWTKKPGGLHPQWVTKSHTGLTKHTQYFPHLLKIIHPSISSSLTWLYLLALHLLRGKPSFQVTILFVNLSIA